MKHLDKNISYDSKNIYIYDKKYSTETKDEIGLLLQHILIEKIPIKDTASRELALKHLRSL